MILYCSHQFPLTQLWATTKTKTKTKNKQTKKPTHTQKDTQKSRLRNIDLCALAEVETPAPIYIIIFFYLFVCRYFRSVFVIRYQYEMPIPVSQKGDAHVCLISWSFAQDSRPWFGDSVASIDLTTILKRLLKHVGKNYPVQLAKHKAYHIVSAADWLTLKFRYCLHRE